MTGSLVLLLLFLCFWLKNVYNQKYEELQKDTDYLFSETVRSIEDEMIEKIYGSPYSLNSMDSSGVSIIKINLNHRIDTIDATAIWNEGLENNPSDSTVKIAFRSKVIDGEEKNIFGSLALSLAIQKDSICLDSSLNFSQDSSILITLEEYLKEDIPAAGIPLAFKVKHLEKGSEIPQKFISSNYTDILSGQSYALVYNEYRPYLFRKMVPEFLFSIFLFSCIAIAFFVVFQSLRQQRKLTQLKNDFVSNITHELKTPITTVGVAIEALSDFDVLKNPDRTQEYLNISKQELKRLTILVDKVLKMSLFEKKEPELKLESLSINQLIQNILDTMKLQFEKLNAQVNFKPLAMDSNLNGDKIHLTSVLYNLIDNALKYSSGKPVIDLQLDDSGNQIKLNIADKGIGIAAEYKEKIFEKFFRVPTGDQHNTKGYGLGLSYVASVIKKHNGTIEVESSLNSGTSFIIYLPKSHDKD
jgi:two-component system, OmpR family, phosphate regulon sensor histidine kinase PhoR